MEIPGDVVFRARSLHRVPLGGMRTSPEQLKVWVPPDFAVNCKHESLIKITRFSYVRILYWKLIRNSGQIGLLRLFANDTTSKFYISDDGLNKTLMGILYFSFLLKIQRIGCITGL